MIIKKVGNVFLKDKIKELIITLENFILYLTCCTQAQVMMFNKKQKTIKDKKRIMIKIKLYELRL